MTALVVGALSAGAVLLGVVAGARERRLGAVVPAGPDDLAGSPAAAKRTFARVARQARRRRPPRTDVLQGQLADAASAIASASRAGLSLRQAVQVAAEQTPPPVGEALREVVDRTSLGASLDEALEGWAAASPIPDVRLATAVLRLHRRTGGALAPVLEGLAKTLRERRAAVREVRSLTAQARLSGAILGLLPVGFFLFLWLTARRDMAAALGTSLGRTAIAVGLGLEAAAFLWIRRLLRVEP
ncbi:MAG TPA: type II secretion system F family protein [Actinomycetota bacterium]|nr:type II secretion system F family protein [Actinomycetota bacterium]